MAQGLEKRWYVRDCVAGQPQQIWLIDDQTATNMGVTNPETGMGTYFKAGLTRTSGSASGARPLGSILV